MSPFWPIFKKTTNPIETKNKSELKDYSTIAKEYNIVARKRKIQGFEVKVVEQETYLGMLMTGVKEKIPETSSNMNHYC